MQSTALQGITDSIKTATTSMTSVPKPLKFLAPHYEALKEAYHNRIKGEDNRLMLADILSVLAISAGPEGKRESLHFRIIGKKVTWPISQ